METPATRLSSVGHGLPLLPKLEKRGRVDIYSEGDLRALSKAGWPSSVSNPRHYG